MSDSYEVYVHFFPNLEVYPRIYYFHRRYSDLLARFKRLTGALPKCFQDDNLIGQLELLKYEFDGGIKVHVFGCDINDLDLVFNVDTQSHGTHQHRMEIAVFHICPKLLIGKEYEMIKSRIKAFILDVKKTGHRTFVFIKCVKTLKVWETTTLQDTVYAAFKEDLKEYIDEHSSIIIDASVQEMRSTISDALESYLAVGFLKIDSHVKLFESKNVDVFHSELNHVFENEKIVHSVKAFLQNARAYVEVKIDIDEKEKTFFKIFANLLKSFGHFIRCSLVEPFARKFGLKVWICNGVLCEVKFEEAILDEISESTKSSIENLANEVYEALLDEAVYLKTEAYAFLYDNIKSDIQPAIENVEKKLHSMQRLSAIFRKMAFETRGYLKQLNIEYTEPPVEQLPNFSKELRQELLSIEGIYGLGNVYGQLEIHIDKDKILSSDSFVEKHDIDNEKHTNDIHLRAVPYKHTHEMKNLTELTSEIASHMRQHHFTGQYAVKYIEKKPKKMVYSFEPGDRLFKQNRDKFGTLGGFIVTKDGTVHGLTCAHVAGERMFIDKGGKEVFSSCSKVFMDKHIDIAALEVIPNEQNGCNQALKEYNECMSKAILSYEHPNTVIGSPVFKYGAASGTTKGFVVSVDYSIFGPETEDYVVLIDTQPDLPTDFRENFDRITWGNDQISSPTLREEDKTSTINPCHIASGQTQNNRDCRSITNDGVTRGQISIYGENTSTTAANAIQSMERNSGKIDHGTCALGNTIVHVRNITFNQTLCPNDGGNSDEVFAKKGDSGSIICIHEALRGSIKHKALSMLSAGDYKIGGDESLKCLSFKLNIGLQMLKQKYKLEFLKQD